MSLTAFGRNLLFMRAFDLAEVGQIALMQIIVMLVGFTQAGLVSGAFILWAGGDRTLNAAMADILHFGTLVLALAAGVGIVVIGSDALAPNVMPETLVIGLAAGIAQMASSWMNNALIADKRLMASSALNVLAVTVSLAVALATIGTPDLRLALASVALQPLVLALGALAINPALWPSTLRPGRNAVTRMLAVGFQPFLGSLAFLMLYQIERWSIFIALGSEELGRYYLVIMYLGFFTLVPIALLNVNFPRASQAIQAGDESAFLRIRRRHLLELAAFTIAALVIQIVALAPVLNIALPQYANSAYLVHLAFVAGLAGMAQDTGTLVLYSIQRTRPILTAGLIALVGFAAALGGLWLAGAFSLETVLFARILSALAAAAWLVVASNNALRNRALATKAR